MDWADDKAKEKFGGLVVPPVIPLIATALREADRAATERAAEIARHHRDRVNRQIDEEIAVEDGADTAEYIQAAILAAAPSSPAPCCSCAGQVERLRKVLREAAEGECTGCRTSRYYGSAVKRDGRWFHAENVGAPFACNASYIWDALESTAPAPDWRGLLEAAEGNSLKAIREAAAKVRKALEEKS